MMTNSNDKTRDSSFRNLITNSMISLEKEEAIPLISFDSITKKFFINESAEKFLKKLEAPLGVVSVAGMYRTGKSYLLNRMLLNRSSGFSVGPTVNPCTKGLWIWPKALSGFSPDGQPVNVLIIDTEGIGATDEDQNHDNKIFTLGLLLSSYFIFNSLGAIDENALHNLSFIVNITKNIQINNSGQNDVEELSKYLPSFMWVLRDFSLKLTDTEGEQITSKEYLENSLSMQKGQSETIETKNKIRHLIREFFRERDCVPLVRPITNESDLQNLAKMDQRDLRQEFLEGVNLLRKKVLHRIKPKQLHGKILNGEMFVNLMKSYVNAINAGAVPVIENAWSYMCKNECSKAMTNSLSKYQEQMNFTARNKFPMDQSELMNFHKEAKQSALSLFSSLALGMYYEDFLKELKAEIKEKSLQYLIENEKITREKCEAFINSKYNHIKQSLSNYSYKSYKEFKCDIQDFISNYLEKAPRGPYRSLFIHEFIVRELLTHSETFIDNLKEELESQLEKSKLQISDLLKKIEKIKSESKEDNKYLEDLLNGKIQTQRKELETQINNLNSKIIELIKEKELTLRDYSELVDSLKRAQELKIKEMKILLDDKEEKINELSKEINVKTGESEKSKQLLEAKVKFLEKELESSSSKEKELLAKSMRKDSVINIASDKYEGQIKTLNEKNHTLQEKNIDLETKLHEKERRIEIDRNKHEEELMELKKTIGDLELSLLNAEEEIKSLQEKINEEKIQMKSYYEEKIKEEKRVYEELQNSIKEGEEKFSSTKNKCEREISLLKQSLEFADAQIVDLKKQIAEGKKSYDNLMNLFQEKNQTIIEQQERHNKSISELNVKHVDEYNKLDFILKEKEADYKFQIERLNFEISEGISKYQNLLNEFKSKEDTMKKRVEEMEESISLLKHDITILEGEKESIQNENKFTLANLENSKKEEIQKILEKTREEIKENNLRNERNINEMRKHYEVEKEAINTKLDLMTSAMKTQMEKLHLDNEEEKEKILFEKESKITELQNELKELNEEYKKFTEYSEMELELRQSHIEMLEKNLSDNKENFMVFKESQEKSTSTLIEEMKTEKNKLENKNEELLKNVIIKERENILLITQKDQLLAQIENHRAELSALKEERNNEKISFEEKIKNLKNMNKKVNEEFLNLKTLTDTTIALKTQENEILTSKNLELTANIENLSSSQEEKLLAAKQIIENEMNSVISTLTKEKNQIEDKYNNKSRELIELQNNSMKEKNMLEKDREILIEKLQTCNQMKAELTSALENEKKNYDAKLILTRNEAKKEIELVMKDNETMKTKMKTLETQYNEISANYEKDQELWNAKYQFLLEQKESAKSDLIECQKKFEESLNTLNRKGVLEKDKMDYMQNALVSSLDLKFKNQLREIKEKFLNKIDTANQQRKEVEMENKVLREKLKEMQESSAIPELEKKILLMSEYENNLKKNFSKTIEDKEKQIKELEKAFFEQKQIYDQKIIAFEEKLVENEKGRSHLAVDKLMEKAVMDKEKQNMHDQIEKLNAKVKDLLNEQKKLNEENKKLMVEKEKLNKGSKLSSKENSFIIPKTFKYMSANKENIRTNSNTSFEVRAIDLMSPHRNLARGDSERSEENDDILSPDDSHNGNIRNTEFYN